MVTNVYPTKLMLFVMYFCKSWKKSIENKIKLILCLVMKWERWIDQHDTRVGRRKNLSPRQEWNPWTHEYQAGALSTSYKNSWRSFNWVHVTFHYSQWLQQCWSEQYTFLSRSSHSSADRAPAHCSGDHGFDSCQDLRLFFCPTLVSCWSIHLSHDYIVCYKHTSTSNR